MQAQIIQIPDFTVKPPGDTSNPGKPADINDSGYYQGWGGGGGGPYRQQCPVGSVVRVMHGRVGENFDKIGPATCTYDGTTDIPDVNLDDYGTYNTNQWTEYGPFKSATFSTDWRNYGFMGHGDYSKWVHTSTCPPGTYISGYFGRSGEMIDSLGIQCGPMKSEYCTNNLNDLDCHDASIDIINKACQNNLEISPLCHNTSVDILNQACQQNMTNTCRDRRQELDEASTVQKFCFPPDGKGALIDDPLCACYIPKPAAIQPVNPRDGQDVSPQCWNAKCATGGAFIPNPLRPCTPLCIQDINAVGESNIIQKNLLTQVCATPSSGSGSGSGSGSSSTGSGSSGSTGTASGNAASGNTSTQIPPSAYVSASTDTLSFMTPTMWMIVIIIVVVLIVIMMQGEGDDSGSQQYSSPYVTQYQQPYQQYQQPYQPYQ